MGSEAGILEQFTATDDRGTRYQIMVSNLGGSGDWWTLLLQPSPPHDPRWLDLIAAPGQLAVRVGLNRSARPPHHATVAACPVTASPGDHVLHAVAARLLSGDDPSGFPVRQSWPRPGRPLASGAEGWRDVIAALQAAGALSPRQAAAALGVISRPANHGSLPLPGSCHADMATLRRGTLPYALLLASG